MYRVVIVLLVVLIPAIVSAQASGRNKLVSGHTMYLEGNYKGALAVYNEVKEKEPGNPAPLYYAACAMAALDQYNEAIAALNAAASIVGDKDASLHAKMLFMSAVVRERQGDLASATTAWNNYISYAKAHGDAVTFIASANSRIEAISKKTQLDKDYQIVRQRIANPK